MSIAKRGTGSFSIGNPDSKSKSSSLSASVVRPTSESMLFELIHLFSMVVIGLGLIIYPLFAKFIDDVIYGTIRMKESWQCAHELLVLYLAEIDRDFTRKLNMGNVFRRGGQDTLMAEARRNAVMFFRTRGENPRGDRPTVKYEVGKNLCKDFNAGRPCQRVDGNGKCLHAHKCDQFVDNKGAAGVCGGAHARCDGCDYDDAHKVKRPAQ